jgi:hypothetical protein
VYWSLEVVHGRPVKKYNFSVFFTESGSDFS